MQIYPLISYSGRHSTMTLEVPLVSLTCVDNVGYAAVTTKFKTNIHSRGVEFEAVYHALSDQGNGRKKDTEIFFLNNVCECALFYLNPKKKKIMVILYI